MLPQRNITMIKMARKIPQPKNGTVEKEEKTRENLVKEANTFLISPKRGLTQSTKKRNNKHTQKQLIPTKIIKMKQLTEQINQGLFQ